MFQVLDQLNWLAVGVATIASFMLGALWFTPLFGKAYDTAMGYKRGKDQAFTPIYYIGPFIGSLATTLATAVLLYSADIDAMSDAITLCLIVGIGYAASVSFVNAINPKTPRPLLYGAVTGGYHIVSILLVGVVLSAIK